MDLRSFLRERLAGSRRLRRSDLRRAHGLGHAVEHDNALAATAGRNALVGCAVA